MIRSIRRLALFLALLVLAGCGPPALRPVEPPLASPTPEPSLSIGLILHLEDDGGPGGAQRYEAIKLAVELANRRGGLQLPTGERRVLRLVVYDDAGRPEMAGATFRRLLDDGVLAVIGPSSPESSAAVRRAAEVAAMPVVTLDDEGGGEAATGRWSFSVVAPPEEALAAAIDYLTASRVERIGWLAPRAMAAASLRGSLFRLAGAANIQIVGEEHYTPGESDVAQSLARLQASGPSVILAWPRDRHEAASIARDAARVRDLVPVLLGPAAADPTTLPLAGDGVAVVRTLTLRLGVTDDLWDHDSLTPVIRDFRREIEARTGRPPSTETAAAWDALRLVVATLERSAASRRALRDGLEATTEYLGASGSISFNGRRHDGLDRRAFVVARADARRWRLPP